MRHLKWFGTGVAAVAAFAVGAAIVIAGGDDPFQGGELPRPESDQAAVEEFTAVLLGEAGEVQYWLGLAGGRDIPCDEPCVRDNDVANQIGGVLATCQKLEPKALASAGGFRPEMHASLTDALTAVCGSLQSAQGTLGAPADTAEWRNVARNAEVGLSQALAATQDALSD